MRDEDDYDQVQPSALRRRSAKAESRLAVRTLLQRLAWTEGTLVYWTGTAGRSAQGSATDVVQRRLLRLSRGAYSIRLRAGTSPDEIKSFAGLLQSLAPAIDELVPVNLPLIARSLRRLADARRFTRLLPQSVGDVDEWRRRCDDALRRARGLIDAAASGDTAAVGRAALVIGVFSSGGSGRPGSDNPVRSGKRNKPASTARETSEPPMVCRALSAWPADLIHEVVRRTGEVPEHLARACPAVNDSAVAAAVRDRLLLAPRSVAGFLDELPSLLATADQLAEVPIQRLRAASAIQRDALEHAITQSGLSGNPVAVFRRAGAINIPLQRFCHYYQNNVTAELASWYAPLPADCFGRSPPPLAVVGDLVTLLRQLLTAELLRGLLLEDASRDRKRKGLIRWRQIGAEGHLLVAGEAEPLTFEQLPDLAARLLWSSTALTPNSPARDIILALAARGAIGDINAVAGWVAWCSHVWPIDAMQHVEAMLLALHVVYAQSPTEHRPAALAALNALGPEIVEHAGATQDTHQTREQRLFEAVRLIPRALANGLTAEQLIRFFKLQRTAALRLIVRLAPSQLPGFSAWLDRLADDDAFRGHARKSYDLTRSGVREWASAYLLFGSQLITRVVDLLVGAEVGKTSVSPAVQALSEFLDGDRKLAYRDEVPPAEQLGSSRAILSAAIPAIRSAVRRVVRQASDRVVSAIDGFASCLAVARDALPEAPPAEIAALAASCFAIMARRGGKSPFNAPLFDNSGRDERNLLIAVCRRSPERLVTLGLASIDLSWRELGQAAEAWRHLQKIEPLPEVISAVAARDGRTQRALRLLARLGLAFRLNRASRLQLARFAQSPAPALPPEIEALAVHLPPEQTAMLAELLRWRTDQRLPDRVVETLQRPVALAEELSSLQSRADLKPAARRRMQHLQAILGDSVALADWVRRDLDKQLPTTLDDARLEWLEQTTAAVVATHFTEMMSMPMPAAGSPQEQRNWDNAVRLYFSVEYNRSLLKRLLSNEIRRERAWILAQPHNAQFLDDARKSGVNTAAWLAPFARTVDSAAGVLRMEIETDPLHVLQMGNYFETCLSEGNINAFSTIANAIEVNKRVIYVYDHRQVVIGRKLIVLTKTFKLVGFCTYGKLPAVRTGADDKHADLKELLDEFCRDFAARCHVPLHSYGHREGSNDLGDDKTFTLFARWYNDGPEPFGERFLGGAKASRPTKKSAARTKKK